MELYCCQKMSLKQMALRKVVVNMWNEPDVLASVQKCQTIICRRKNSENEWKETVDNKIIHKISQLLLSEKLKKQMVHLVRPMSLDTFKWKRFHVRVLTTASEYLDMHILEQICRTCTCAIDYQETAAKIVRLGMLNVGNRYRLACMYCLVDIIPTLWEELPDGLKEIYGNEKMSVLNIRNMNLEFYWPYVLKGEESRLNVVLETNFFSFAFRYSAKRGNKAATEYFFQKLTNEERVSCLFTAVYTVIRNFCKEIPGWRGDLPKIKLADVLCYLLTLMSAEQQMYILKEQPCNVLKCFVNWPWQDLFMKIADIVWTFLPENSCDQMLLVILGYFKNSGYYFPNFFRDFFSRSPINFRKHSVGLHSSLFSHIFNAEDTKTIEVFFRNIDAEDRVKIVSSCDFFKLLDALLMRDKQHLVELCFREATLSNEDFKKLKESFMVYLTEINTTECNGRKSKWEEFPLFLNATNVSAENKRSFDGEAVNECKKLCKKKKKRNRMCYQNYVIHVKEYKIFGLKYYIQFQFFNLLQCYENSLKVLQGKLHNWMLYSTIIILSEENKYKNNKINRQAKMVTNNSL